MNETNGITKPLSEAEARKKLHDEIEARSKPKNLSPEGEHLLAPDAIVAEFDHKGRFVVNVSDRIDAVNLLQANSADGKPGCIAIVVYDGRNFVGLAGRLIWLLMEAWDWHKKHNVAAQKRGIVSAGLGAMANMLKTGAAGKA